MIRSFADKETERISSGERSRKRPPDIQPVARRKLRQLDSAERLDDLRVPRGNRLEQLKGFEPLRYSIGSMASGESPSAGLTEARTMFRIEDYHRG